MGSEKPQFKIGPNAILQLIPILTETLGQSCTISLLTGAGLNKTPNENLMIDETSVAKLHRTIRRELPDLSRVIMRKAGENTGNYILNHRIPRKVQFFLKWLPTSFSSQLLARAIKKHSWTFSGSGTFKLITSHIFELYDNPMIKGEINKDPICHWHAAVFERLYQILVQANLVCLETECKATGAKSCRFIISPS